MQGQFLIIGSAVVIAFVIVIVILHLVNRAEAKYYKNKQYISLRMKILDNN